MLPQRLFNSYTKAHNKRYGHSGTLFEGNYRVKPVDTEEYLFHLCRYIHANPVIHGLVDEVADWPCSNHPEWVGEREGTLIDGEFVRAHFYRAFVVEWLADRHLPKALAGYVRPGAVTGATHLGGALHLTTPLEPADTPTPCPLLTFNTGPIN